MNKKRNKLVTIFITLTLITNSQITYAAGTSSLQDKMNKNNQQIDALEKQEKGVQDQKANEEKNLDDVMKKVNAKSAELAEANKKVQSFQSKIDELQSNISNYQSSINANNEEIKLKELLIKDNEEEIIEREKMLDDRLRSYYKNNMSSQIIHVIAKSGSISEMINTISTISKLMSMDSKLMKEVKEIKEALEKEKVTLQKKVDNLNEESLKVEALKNEQVNAQKEFILEKNKYETEMNELKNLEDAKQKVVNSLSSEEKALQEKIGDLNDFNEGLQKQIDEFFNNINGNSNVDNKISNGEGFLKPANGAVTSPYGPRVHPIFGTNGFHTGVDFGAPNNSSIYASKSGRIVFAGVQSGYGNTVIIDHGGGVQTLYAHCSSILVSYGQNVARGQVVAKVGSTGNSTGPHLHFEVRINGKHTNPMQYLG
ncbi:MULTISPECIES: peptidoglycan DD-metalloendopeptidase family protein [Clostridium]|uniref:Peptidoglycan DD-metalloendopeptidase family protein n=1 Tax=Clostridium cibarium TaxID=2762247 RepID=A0ABR8PXX3_9CLOT|nr:MULTISPECIES: peptidoglycan DD-metalloendopeptidase family protein [Clostridium]MBD7913008.1 peptidoglycan DD-metalloendopeptidase family protein [Clostridium cibarium]